VSPAALMAVLSAESCGVCLTASYSTLQIKLHPRGIIIQKYDPEGKFRAEK